MRPPRHPLSAHPRQPTAASPRRGFTLVELLVVIAIIGVLISLLLPAIQSAREAARRIECQNNLKQLAVAALSYESSSGFLPPSATLEPEELILQGVPYPVVDHERGKQFGWAVLLLPQIEQQALYDRFDFERSVFEQDGDPQAEFVSAFLCPSDEALGRYYTDEEFSAGRLFAKGNYAAYVSPFHVDLQLMYPGALVATGQPASRVEDGMSNTIAFSEVRTLDVEQDERGAWALPWAGASLLSFDMHHLCGDGTGLCPEEPYFRANPRSLGLTQTPNVHRTRVRDTLHRCSGTHQVQADLEKMPCEEWRWPVGLTGYYSASPRSRHPGGVLAAFLDGHVNFIADEVDEFRMAYLVSINDGLSESGSL